MNLYFCSSENEDGESLDLFITADSPQAAALMFRAEWADYLDDDELSGPFIPSTSIPFESALLVYSVHPDPECAGVLSWHSREPGHHGHVKLEGYVLE